MELTRTADKKSLASYAELVRRVREAIRQGKERALEAVERESVRTKWEVGKLVHEHLLLNQSRADYGKRVILRLSRDIGISDRELRYMVEFARTYPISPPAAKLSWGHLRDLLAINEEEQRKGLIQQASKKKWARSALRREISRRKANKQITVTEAPAEEPLVPRKGTPDTYRIITAKAGPWAGELAIDLGFANYLSLEIFSRRWPQEPLLPASGQQGRRGVTTFKDRDIVEIAPPRGGGVMTVAKDATEADLFTYRAYLLQVTDADTLWVLIDLGFGFVTQQHLRLRGLDAPEITSRSGQEAKRFVEGELKKAPQLLVTTTKSDKYDRYLVDLFYTVKGEERFLNNRLLSSGLAQTV